MNLLNIANLNIEDEIREVITIVRKELNNLTDERTCIIYTSYIYKNLRDKSILCYMIDTESYPGMDYGHRFVVVPRDEKNFYVIDLTYRQFGMYPAFSEIYSNGYQLMSKKQYLEYLDNIEKVAKRAKTK